MMKKIRIFLYSVLIFCLFFAFLKPSSASLGDFDITNNQVPLKTFMSGGPKKDGIPALTNPKFVVANKAGHLSDDDIIVGVVIGGEAKAYPVNILNWHEIVNDSIDNIPYVVTWCPLTKSAVTFDRRVDGETLEFGVSGLLYNSNVVMYDRSHDGLWSQMKMGGLTGKHGHKDLALLASYVTTWKQWRETHPGTKILSEQTGHLRNYSHDPYGGYHQQDDIMFPLANYDRRLPLKSIVLGVKIENQAKAYLLKDLPPLLEDEIAGMDIKVIVKSGNAYIQDSRGNTVPSVISYWFAWSTFNKDTLIY